MIPASDHEFFVAIAGASGALAGLVFVAISVYPERLRDLEQELEFQLSAAGTLLLFSSALILSLVALVPQSSLGWWALSIGVVGLAFAAAMARLLAGAVRKGLTGWTSLRRIRSFVFVFGWQLAAGIELLAHHQSASAVQTLDYVLIGTMAAAIFRAGALVGLRDTGLISSIRTLARGETTAQSSASTVVRTTGGADNSPETSEQDVVANPADPSTQ